MRILSTSEKTSLSKVYLYSLSTNRNRARSININYLPFYQQENKHFLKIFSLYKYGMNNRRWILSSWLEPIW